MTTPLVLLPGLLNDEALYARQVDSLEHDQLAACHVFPLTGADSVAALADEVLARAPERFALAGLSMGGYVALEIMRRAPDRVLRLALMDTNAHADAAEAREKREGFIAMARDGRFPEVPGQIIPNLVAPAHAENPAITGPAVSMAERVGPDAFVRQQTAIMGRPDSRGDLGAIGCPTLVLCGRDDQLTPPAVHAEMAGAIPDSRLVVVDDAGHLTPLERPQAVTAVLGLWLQG